jgi:hypothetical protein
LPTQEGTTDLPGLQASYASREAGCVFCALEASGRVLLENELALCIAVADLVIKGQAMSFQSCTPRAMRNCQVQR